MLKKVIKSVLGSLGYELKRKSPFHVNRFEPGYLSGLCQPATVIDVGVGHGTPALYEAYPTARFVLIEPLDVYSEDIAKIAASYKCEVFYKAVGIEQKMMEITLDVDDPERSSFSKRTELTSTGSRTEKKQVEVTTLDNVMREIAPLETPVVLKLDTEGHEIEALRGATELLAVTDYVISEISIGNRFENDYDFEDVVEFMKHAGFTVFSIPSLAHVEGELRPRYCDVIFRRRNQPS